MRWEEQKGVGTEKSDRRKWEEQRWGGADRSWIGTEEISKDTEEEKARMKNRPVTC